VRGIASARNEVTEGVVRLATSAPSDGPLAWTDPALAAVAFEWARRQAELWSALLARRTEALEQPEPGDRRFGARAWDEDPYYAYLKQSYLLAVRQLTSAAERLPLSGLARERLRFALRQWLDAISPANHAATNPEVVRAALASRGESLVRGVANLIADARRGRIAQTDESAFAVGRNLAVTPGAVVSENALAQLIQYAPRTARVGVRPLVIVPPCINKYYILDLQPHNSFVRYALDEGHQVFLVSWRNAGPPEAHYGWDDYLELGVFEALRVAREIAASDRVNALGFCIGGTMLGAALAVLAARGDDAVVSATFLTAMHDFSEPGPIGVFIDPVSVAAREAEIGRGGVFPGAALAFVFSALRANDLVWPYVVRNYLMGETPPAFDLLYWNADSTNLPGPMYCDYVRNTYLENRLREPGALVNCGVPIDLGSVRCPAFFFAAREDHIVPWRSAYRSLQLFGGERTFVLGASGHIAGVVNPPAQKRRSHWVGEALPGEPQAWLAAARERPGSWWPLWSGWLWRHAGGERAAPAAPGSPAHPAIEPAPGRYVMEKAEEALCRTS